MFKVSEKENTKTGNGEGMRLPMGKGKDEEGGEMGVWVVSSGGQGDGGGRICLC